MPDSIANPSAVRGRGALTNASGRYESQTVEAFDDGWTDDDEPKKLTTTLQRENARKIITRNDSPDIGFNASINPYRGCEHGCVYILVTQLAQIVPGSLVQRLVLVLRPSEIRHQIEPQFL